MHASDTPKGPSRQNIGTPNRGSGKRVGNHKPDGDGTDIGNVNRIFELSDTRKQL